MNKLDNRKRLVILLGFVFANGLAGCNPNPADALPVSEFGIGSTMISEIDGMELVYIPEGEFMMGSDGNLKNERPAHSLHLDAYWIDKTEVTNAMFEMFVSDTEHQTVAEAKGNSMVNVDGDWVSISGADWAHPSGPDSGLGSLEQYPVVQVGWQDADAYCTWAGRRLPTEAEWEKASRGTDGRIYLWGDVSNANSANYDNGMEGITAVGSFPEGVSSYGSLDMAGNAWEFVADWYGEFYYQSSPEENPTGPNSGRSRIVRGGSWSSNQEYIRSSYRGQHLPTDPFGHIGFRCALSAQP